MAFCDIWHNNEIEQYRNFANDVRNSNMQLSQRMDARLKLYDSMSMAVSSDTYRAIGGRRTHDYDWYCFSEVQGSDWDLCLILKRPLSTISDPRFSSFFSKIVWPFLQSFLHPLGLAYLCEYNRMPLGQNMGHNPYALKMEYWI